jgi:hypothetical protein
MANQRARDGRFTYDGDYDRLCRCGHRLGVHAGAAPHDCFNEDPSVGDGCECKCQKFRPAKPVQGRPR